MKQLLIAALLFIINNINAQELYVFTEPASNMPSNSIGIIQSARFLKGIHTNSLEQRHNTEVMFGFNKNLMLHAATTFSNMHVDNIFSKKLRWESVRAYAKYRFLSKDEMFKHFRMAAFAEASYSRNQLYFDELSLEGDNSGVQLGVIATQLLHKLAISASSSYITYTGNYKTFNSIITQPLNAVNYSLSAGYLVFPKDYTDYNQTNLNLYAELLGQKSLDQSKYFVDIAPALQLIFNSQAKLNIGYRYELNSNMHRMSRNCWLIELEWIFLNALKK
jgi:hypothetical protein